MRKLFTFILTTVFLSAGLVGCSKDDSSPKTQEEKDEAVKASLVGYWERESFTIDGYKNGTLVDKNINDQALRADISEELPPFIEFTKTKFIMVAGKNERRVNSYTLDSKTNTIVVIDDSDAPPSEEDINNLAYSLSDNNKSLTIVIIDNGIDLDEYDSIRVNIKLKSIAKFPF